MLAASVMVSRWWHDGGHDGQRDGVTIVTASDRPATRLPIRQEARVVPPPAVAGGEPGRAPIDQQQLYLLVREEARDAGWASRSERTIADRLAGLPFLAADAMTVRCATTVCEVTGTAAAGSPPEDVAAAWTVLRARDAAAHDDALIPAGSSFGSGRSMHAFVLYYRRG